MNSSAQVLMKPGLSKSSLWRDRVKRHALYYAAKSIEKNEPPKLIINSFWRSGSTYLLEFLADVFFLRPYFEPLSPREPVFQACFNSLPQTMNHERLYPVPADVNQDLIKVLEASRFQSKWVYQCQSLRNVGAKNGKLVKMVRGLHLYPELIRAGIPVIHLKRDVLEVAESFLNSKWTLKFFEGIDLNYLLHSADESVAAFYKKYQRWLNLDAYPLIEQVAIYHCLTELFAEHFEKNIYMIDYAEVVANPAKIAQRVSDKLGLLYDDKEIERFQNRPSRMTVYNAEKKKLNADERARVLAIREEIMNH